MFVLKIRFFAGNNSEAYSSNEKRIDYGAAGK
jgi:hypothetical protein